MLKTKNGKGVSWLALAAAVGLGGYVDNAEAQQTPAPAVRSESEVVVTATRREQALQDIPIAVTAVSGEELERASVTSTADLMRVAPTLQIQSTNSETGGSTIRIRGVGTTGNNVGLEGAVGVFIDGVYRQRAGLAMNNMFDIGRIEVLRGPQGTLFGKNTSAGAIAVTPNAPKLGAFDASAELGYGNYENRELKGMLNLPMGETLALRFSGAYQARDGYIEDVGTGDDGQSRDRRLYRGMLLWAPTDNISWRGSIDYSEKDENCCQAIYRIAGGATLLQNSLVPGSVIQLDQSQYQSNNTPGRPFVEQTEDIGYSSHLIIDLSDSVTFKNIIAHRRFEAFNNIDADFGPADILHQNNDSAQELTSFEATLEGTWGKLDWLIGGYYSDETIDLRLATIYGADVQRFVTAATGGLINAPTAAALYPTGGGNTNSFYEQEGTSYSFFTHNQIQITDRLGAVVGLRYNQEEKEGGLVSYTTNSPSCGGGPFDGQGAAPPPGIPSTLRLLCPRPTTNSIIDEQETTGTFGLNYKLTDDILTYASFSRGYKAGGINLDRDAAASVLGLNPASGLVIGTPAAANSAAAFAPEFSNSYEIGIRSQFFDRTLTVNVTLFQTDYEDFQLNTFSGLGFSIANAGSVESRGFEIEGNWRAGEDLTFTYGLANVNAKYGFEPVLRFDPPDNAAPLPPNLPLAGRTLTNAPEWALSWGVHYEHTLRDSLRGFFDIGASYRTSLNTGSNLNTSKIDPALTLINGRMGIFSDTQNGWELALWGNNLFNEYYRSIAFDTVFQSGSISDFPGAPRMFGVTFRKQF
jgi:outer membrane receptor protein involved in Fe transport